MKTPPVKACEFSGNYSASTDSKYLKQLGKNERWEQCVFVKQDVRNHLTTDLIKV